MAQGAMPIPAQPPREEFKYLMESLGTEFQRIMADNESLRLENARFKSAHERLMSLAPSGVLAEYKNDPAYLETLHSNELKARTITKSNAQLSGDTPPHEEDNRVETLPKSGKVQDTDMVVRDVSGPSPDSVKTLKSSPTGPRKGSAMAAKLQRGAVGQFRQPGKPLPSPKAPEKKVWDLKAVVTDIRFDSFFGFMIFVNSVIMALEAQYRGIDDGYNIHYHSSPRAASDAWPGAKDVFSSFELFFGILFSVEVVIKIVALRHEFAKSSWNWFDLVIVLFWVFETAMSVSDRFNPMLLRVLRLFRLLRLAKMVKKVAAFDSLQVLLGSIESCVPVLVWSAALLLLFQMVCGMVLQSLLADFFASTDDTDEKKQEVYQFFGTFTRSMMSMSEITLSNWMTPTRKLVENVSEWFALYCLIYKLTVGFAVVRVISGVFLHETFKVANSDDDLMIVQKRRMIHKHRTKMTKLLKETDRAGDGMVDRAEFQTMLQDVNLKTWLAAQEVECGDSDILFDFLDGGDGEINQQEMIDGIQRMKGPARSIDVNALIRMVVHIDGMLERLDDKVEGIEQILRPPTDKKTT